MQFIGHGQPGNLRQVEGSQPDPDTHQYGLGGFAGGLLVNAILLDRNAFRVTHGQTLEEDIQRRLEVFILLFDLSTAQEFHDHAEVLFLRRGLMQQVQHEGLKQRSLGFFPKRVGALCVGRCGVLNEVGDQLQHILVIPHIPKGVITEGRIRVKQIEHPHLISHSFEKATRLAQDLSLGIGDYHRAASTQSTFADGQTPGLQHIGHRIGTGLAGTCAADDQHVGVVFMLIAVHPDAEVARHQQVGTLGIPVSVVEFFRVPPTGRAVFLTRTGVAVFTGRNEGNHSIQAGEYQQKARGLAAPRKGKRLRQHLIAGVQKVRQIHAGLPAHSHGNCGPPDQRKRQQPDPPWGWRFLQSANHPV